MKQWKTIRVFVSSTFKDMHPERDYLNRVIFPELRERCSTRGLHFVGIDLRWGVTNEEAEQNKALEICLSEIDKCRPYFIGILGQRYGWVPDLNGLAVLDVHPWLTEYPERSMTEYEVLYGALLPSVDHQHAFFYFRNPFDSAFSEGYERLELEQQREIGEIAATGADAEKLMKLKDLLCSQYDVFEYSCDSAKIDRDEFGGSRLFLEDYELQAFGQRVLEDIWSAIVRDNPIEDKDLTDPEIERQYHDNFVASWSQMFVGREDVVKDLKKAVGRDSNRLIVIHGIPGCGKSSLLAHFVTQYRKSSPASFLLYHFIGAGPGSTNIRSVLTRLCNEIALYLGEPITIPPAYKAIQALFGELVEKVSDATTTVLVLDALDQLDETHHAHMFDWLPQRIPHGLQLIVATSNEADVRILRQFTPAPFEIVIPLLEHTQQELIARSTLDHYGKRLNTEQLESLCGNPAAHNPLFLRVACEELRVFPYFEHLSERIAQFPTTEPELFQQVLERLENDYGSTLVETTLGLLACARFGLYEAEILELQLESASVSRWVQLYRALTPYLQPKGYEGEGRLSFFHRQLADAVKHRYLKTDEQKTQYHKQLAVYFRHKADPAGDKTWQGEYPRGFSELQYHLFSVESWSEVAAVAQDFAYLDAKVHFLGILSLLEDDYPKILSDFPQTHEQWRLLRDLYRLLRRESYALMDSADTHALFLQQVLNAGTKAQILHSRFVYMKNHIKPLLTKKGTVWLELEKYVGLHVGVSGGVSRSMNHGDVVQCIAFSPDGTILYSGGNDGNIQIWDPKTDDMITTIKIDSRITGLAVSPDGAKLAVSQDARYGPGIRMLYSMSGGHIWSKTTSQGANCIAFSADGKYVASGNKEGTVNIWNSDTGDSFCELKHPEGIQDIAFSPDNRLFVSACEDGLVRLWDYRTGTILRDWGSFPEGVTAVTFSPTGGVLAWGGREEKPSKWLRKWGGRAIAWDMSLECFKWEKTIATSWPPEQQAWICTMAFSPDGSQIAVGTRSGMVMTLDIDSGEELKHWGGHEWIHSVAFSPTQPVLASGSFDQTIRLWDISKSSGNFSRNTLYGRFFRKLPIFFGSYLFEVFRYVLHNLSGHHFRKRRRLKANYSDTGSFSFSRDGMIAAISVGKNTIHIWDTRKLVKIAELAGEDEEIWNVQVSSDGKKLVYNSTRNMYLYDIESQQIKYTIQNPGWIHSLAISDDLKYIACGAEKDTRGMLLLWDIEQQRWIARQAVDGSEPDVRFVRNKHRLVVVDIDNQFVPYFWRFRIEGDKQ